MCFTSFKVSSTSIRIFLHKYFNTYKNQFLLKERLNINNLKVKPSQESILFLSDF